MPESMQILPTLGKRGTGRQMHERILLEGSRPDYENRESKEKRTAEPVLRRNRMTESEYTASFKLKDFDQLPHFETLTDKVVFINVKFKEDI